MSRCHAPIAVSLIVCAWIATVFAAQEPPRFEVASVRPNTSDQPLSYRPAPDGLTYVNFPLYQIIINAYGVQLFQAEGMPAWALEAQYDIVAKASREISDSERLLMLQALLTERFSLEARLELKERTAYVLTRGRADGALGPGLIARADCATAERPCEASGTGARRGGYIRGQAFPMNQLRRMLSIVLEQVVVDETQIEGVFDVDLSWRPDNATVDDARPSLFTAVEEQLGLKLTPQRRRVEVLVIDALDRATPQ